MRHPLVSSLQPWKTPLEGDPASFTTVLSSPPTANVTIPLTSSTSGVYPIPNSVTFTPDNWNVPQTIDVLTDNDTSNGDLTVTISTGVPVSSDTNYSLAAADTEDFTITVVDDEVDTDGDGVFDYSDAFLQILMRRLIPTGMVSVTTLTLMMIMTVSLILLRLLMAPILWWPMLLPAIVTVMVLLILLTPMTIMMESLTV